MNYGLDLENSAPKPEDYSFGAISGEPLNPSGDWTPYLPTFEKQRKRVDVQGCVSFTTLSALEIIHKKKWGVEPNFSDRFLAKVSETTRSGNTPKRVAHALRKKGAVDEAKWPFSADFSWEDYYAQIPSKLLKTGQKWAENHAFSYEWVKEREIKEALKFSPLGVAVSAWKKVGNYYVRFTDSNHYCVLVKWDEAPIVFDTYEENLKTLAPDFGLEYIMRYNIEKSPRERWWDFIFRICK